MKKIIAAILLLAIILTSCKTKTRNLTDEFKDSGKKVTPSVKDEQVLPTPIGNAETSQEALLGFSVDLFKKSYDAEKNTLISPASVSLALGMTAGGSGGNTLTEFQNVLGRGVSLSEMNSFYKSLTERLDNAEETEVNVANSIWIRDNKDMISVKDTFLKFTDEYYDAEVYLSPFNKSTLRDINSWVEDETDGMIKKIIDDIDPLTVMYLINALSFEAKWERKYTDTSDYFRFTDKNGNTEKVTGMSSDEYTYLEDENTKGFIKDYKGKEFSFAVLLPDEDTDIDTYVDSLTAEKINTLLNNKTNEKVETTLPKFTYEYDISLKDTLINMGLGDAFDESLADFSQMGSSSLGNIYVSDVLHKTFIEVAEEGTKAAAVTAVIMKAESAMPIEEVKRVIVNRPFVFMILDNESNTPLFIGSVLSVK